MSSRIDPWFWMRTSRGWAVAVEECNTASQLQDCVNFIQDFGHKVVVTFPDYRYR